VLFAIALVFAMGTACSGGGHSQPSPTTTEPPDPGFIAYWRAKSGYLDIVVMRPDGSDSQVIAEGSDPAWSPSGRYLAYDRDCGTGPTPYACSEVWRLTVDRPGHALQLSPSALFAEYPDWSPDGRQIAFDGSPHSTRDADIYVMPASGGTATPLTHSRADEEDPSWSPDGTRIAYSSFGPNWNRDSPDIYVMNADGSDQHAVTTGPAYDYLPDWSPDGQQIVFQRQYRGASPYWPNNEIVVVNADGTGFHRLTNTPRLDDWWPVWSPDGTQIAFVSDNGNVGRLVVMNADGSERAWITKHQAERPDWGGAHP
jgi:Tol biopolymer transport system component